MEQVASFFYATGRERRCEKKSISNSWDITFITVAIMTSGELGTRCCVVFSAEFFLMTIKATWL